LVCDVDRVAYQLIMAQDRKSTARRSVRSVFLIIDDADAVGLGRRLEGFPFMVEDHNKAVAKLEEHLVKYLKGGHVGKTRPTLKKGGFLGIGGEKKVGWM